MARQRFLSAALRSDLFKRVATLVITKNDAQWGSLGISASPFTHILLCSAIPLGTFSSTVSKTKGMTIGTTILYAVKMQICAINAGNFPFVKGVERIL